MSGAPAGVVVNHLIAKLTDIRDHDNDDNLGNKEEREDPLSPAEGSTRSLEDVEQRSVLDESIRLSDHRQRKRTTISQSQKAILEEFYASGMTSSAMQFAALHHAAAHKTGLSVQNIQHWIRNRRRPACKDKMGPVSNYRSMDAGLSTITCAISSPGSDSMVTNSPLYLIDGSTDQIKNCFHSSEGTSQLASVIDTAPVAILVKCRIADSIEEDFVEVEVPSLTYMALLQACCDELEVELNAVAKIRKLPNTLVRKDKDVMRLSTLQELELVLHSLTHT